MLRFTRTCTAHMASGAGAQFTTSPNHNSVLPWTLTAVNSAILSLAILA